MTDWRLQRWSLSYLPPSVRWQLADSLDTPTATGLGYPRFAAELRFHGAVRYTAQQIELIRERSAPGSATLALLLDYEARGGMIQDVQLALESIGHVAQAVIPDYFQREAMAQVGFSPNQYRPYNSVYPEQPFNGNQQTEPSMCNCQQCWQRYFTSGYCSGESGRPDVVQRQRSLPVGSISTRSPGSGNRRRHPTEPTTAGSGLGVNIPSSIDPSASSRGNSVLQNPRSKQRVSETRGTTAARGITGEITHGSCNCESCRLGSDPEQTQRLTLHSDPKTPCLFTQDHADQSYTERYRTPKHSENISDGLSQLYLDTDESVDTLEEDVENSDQTSVKGLFSVPERGVNSNLHSETGSVQTGSDLSIERRPICAKSDTGQHRLGDMISSCPVCKKFNGANTGSRPRNNSAPQKSDMSDTEARRSWHGSPEHKENESMRTTLSDSVLEVFPLPNENFAKAAGDRDINIESTMLSRISPHNSISGSVSARIQLDIPNSQQSLSNGQTYRNNLESGKTSLQPCSRNIIPSDSSNCSKSQTRASLKSHSITGTSVSIEVSDSLPNKAASNEQSKSTSDNYAQRESTPPEGAHGSSASASGSQSNRRSRNSGSGMGAGDEGWGNGGQGRGNGGRGPDENGSGDFVFCTYAWNGHTDSEQFIRDVILFCKKLRQAGIRVKIDMDENSYAALRLNKLDWIDKHVREAKYVIVCISPTYAADTMEPDARRLASPRNSQLNARYIFDKLREEYYSNQSQNRRTIPVLFSNFGATTDHVPSCMRSTLIYKYPNDIEQIIESVLGHARFRPS